MTNQNENEYAINNEHCQILKKDLNLELSKEIVRLVLSYTPPHMAALRVLNCTGAPASYVQQEADKAEKEASKIPNLIEEMSKFISSPEIFPLLQKHPVFSKYLTKILERAEKGGFVRASDIIDFE